MTESREVDPLAELRREHSELIRPFLERVSTLADLLENGSRVSPERLRETIQVWQEYVHEAHRSRLAALESEKAFTCGPGLQEVIEDEARSPQRMSRLSILVEDYRRGAPHGAIALATALRSSAYVDRVWVEFEESHPFSCLSRALTASERERIGVRFREGEGRIRELEQRIRKILAEPVEIVPGRLELRCSVAECRARTSVPLLGRGPGDLRIGDPGDGWTERPAASGEGAGQLAFFCPAHGRAAA